MNMYGSNAHKRAGIKQQPFIAHKIRKLFESQGYVVNVRPATRFQDMKEKYDYEVFFNKPLKTKTGETYDSIKIDVKWAKSFTLYDNNGENTLKNSKSMFIVFNHPDNPAELMFINTERFRECLNINNPTLRMSEEAGNKSQYFFVEQYIRENREFLGNYIKRYTV